MLQITKEILAARAPSKIYSWWVVLVVDQLLRDREQPRELRQSPAGRLGQTMIRDGTHQTGAHFQGLLNES